MEKPWRRTIDNVNILATDHSKFASQVAQNLAQSLIQYNSGPEASSMETLDRNILEIGRGMMAADDRMHKTEQNKSKKKSSKQSDANEDMRKARARWDSEAPNCFERLQQIDQSRITFLKDVLVRYETAAIDLHNTQVQNSESAMACLLEINAPDEIGHFIARAPETNLKTATASALRPPISITRAASHGDSGSLRSAGGPSSSLKSKFGTLLKGKNTGSPHKRQSILPNFLSSNTPRRSDLPEVSENQRSSIGLEHSRDTILPNDGLIRTSNGDIATSIPTLKPAEFGMHAIPVVMKPSQRPRNADNRPVASGNIHNEDQVLTAQNSLRGVTIQTGAVNSSSLDEDNAAIDRVSSKLRAQPTISKRVRGRRDVRSAVYDGVSERDSSDIAWDILGSPLARNFEPGNAEGQSSLFLSQNVLSQRGSLDRSDSRSALSNDGSESIRSTRSYSASNTISKHPNPSSSGVHTSVIETVNLSLAANGTASEISVYGEIAMANISPTDEAPLTLEIISPDVISQVVANLHVLSTVGPNSYQLGATSVPSMTTLLKYQVHPEDSLQSQFIPIQVHQLWSPEKNQTSVKLVYRLNPAFGAASITLQDVEVAISIDGIASSCVAKPPGTFVKRSSKLVWRLNELNLESGQDSTLLARFKTQQLCPPAKVIELRFKTALSGVSRGSGVGVLVTKLRDNPFADIPTVENISAKNTFIMQSGRFTLSTMS